MASEVNPCFSHCLISSSLSAESALILAISSLAFNSAGDSFSSTSLTSLVTLQVLKAIL
jgi:hypothetical protein